MEVFLEHIALYRKYRPKTFEEVVGQESVTETLINQISSNRLSHAYLFNGPRGTGKTTCAKIISRLVNCLNPNGHNPCNECDNCKQILADSFLDVIEMDAASHNGVDDIRELIDGVRYPPSIGKMKVVIIDEAHMITKSAFNALLKTIEEPPSYMIFIFATTEPNKIPQTIISRCQRFDFKRIDSKKMQNYLASLAKVENINVNEDALQKISKLSSGAMRDALGVLEKTSSSKYDEIGERELEEILGASGDEIEKIVFALSNSDIVSALNLSSEVYYSGKDLSTIRKDIIEFLRKGMLYSAGVANKVSEVKPRELAFFENIKAKEKHAFFVYALGEFIESGNEKNFDNIRAEFEYTLANICLKNKKTDPIISDSLKTESKAREIENQANNIENEAKEIKSERLESKQMPRTEEPLENNKDENLSESKQDVQITDSDIEKKIVNQVVDEEKITNDEKFSNNDSKDLIANWKDLLKIVQKKNPYANTVICKLNPISVENGLLKASFPENLKALSMGFESRGLKDILQESIKEFCNEDVEISII